MKVQLVEISRHHSDTPDKHHRLCTCGRFAGRGSENFMGEEEYTEEELNALINETNGTITPIDGGVIVTYESNEKCR